MSYNVYKVIDGVINMNIKNATFLELKQGYYKENNILYCLHCNYLTRVGEVYPLEGHFYIASKMMEKHQENEHQSSFTALAKLGKNYHGLTDKQREIIELLYQGLKDRQIADNLGVSESTIRHQRFVLKEKANQARMFLAMYELVKEQNQVDDFIDLHRFAKQVDDRYQITKQDEQKVYKDCFISLEPLKLKIFPKKEKYKIVILNKISELFSFDNVYSEMEVNIVLKDIFDDYVTLRRYLIEYGFFERTKDGSIYQRV